MFRGLVPTFRSFDRHIRICYDLLFYYDDRPGLSSAFVVVYGGYAGLCVVGCAGSGMMCGFGFGLRCGFRVLLRVVYAVWLLCWF